VEHLSQENTQRSLTEKIRVEGGDFAGLKEDGAERLNDEIVIVNFQHLDEVRDYVIVIEFVVEKVEVDEVIEHVNDVEQDFENQRVVLNLRV
jgi:hypothetical protein